MAEEVKTTVDLPLGDAPFIPDPSSSIEVSLSSFSQVIFPDIPDLFPPETDTTISYILSEAIQPSSRDWVGLFRVGWSNPREYVTYVWSTTGDVSNIENNAQKVTFKASQLPGDDGEFYQFCYVTTKGYIRGASTPFQFRVSTENDHLVEVEDETGLIILKTKSDTLEEKISSLNLEKQSFQTTIDGLTKTKHDLDVELQRLSDELGDGQQRCKITEDKNTKLQATLLAKSRDLEKLTKRLGKADSRIEKTKAQLAEAEATIGKLVKELNECRKRIEEVELLRAASEEKHAEEMNVLGRKIQEQEQERFKMLDEIKTLSLIQDETQRANSMCKKEKEEALFASIKMREEASVKMKRFKDERDLFKAQLTESELIRQEVLENLRLLTEKLGQAENKVHAVEGEVEMKNEKLEEVTKKLSDFEAKHQHEVKKCQGLLRESLDHGRATKTAKDLIAEELSATTAIRDCLLEELNTVKQEKEKLLKEVQVSRSTLRAVQCQLETVEEKLACSESCLSGHERLMKEEREKAEKAERQMHGRILSLQKQLEKACNALAKETAKASKKKGPSVSKRDCKTQTSKSTMAATEVQPKQVRDSAASTEEGTSQDFVVNDLKSQVEDLTTRLNMGAEAYKEKFIECHKLERKMKKLKLANQQSKQSSSSEVVAPATASSTAGEERKEPSEGWGSKLEKLFIAIADPDSEEKEQTSQLHQTIEVLERKLEILDAKQKRYKQLYKEEKEKMNALASSNGDRQSDISQALNEAKSKNAVLAEENQMLRAQLKGFVARSDDVTLRDLLTYQGSMSSDELSSSPENLSKTRDRDTAEDEMQFEDALGVPMYATSASSSEKSSPTSSDITNDSKPEQTKRDGAGFGNFNMCSDRGRGGTSSSGQETGSMAIPRKSRVINKQPIRSPTQLSDIVQASSQASQRVPGQARKRNGKSGKTSSKGKSKKSLKGAM